MKGHIRERSPGVFEVIAYVGKDERGRPRYRSRTCREGRRAAQKLLNAMLAEVATGAARPHTAETLADYLQGWLATTAALRLTAKSLQTYRTVFERQVIPNLGAVELDRLTVSDVEAWLVKLLAPGGRQDGREGALSVVSVRYYLTLLRTALNDAVRRGRLQRNPCAGAAIPKAPALEVEALSEAQLRRLIHAASGRLRMACVLGAGLGLRRGEVAGLQWADIDEVAGVVHIRRAVEDTKLYGCRFKPPKSGKPRTLPLPSFVAMELRRWKGEQAQDRLLFGPDWNKEGMVCSAFGGGIWGPSGISVAFAELAEKLNLPTRRFHALRHSCATTLLGRGTGVSAVQAILGHSSPAFTLTKYGHALPEHLSAAAVRMDAALTGVSGVDKSALGSR